jgi:glyoxylase-like metal-dependent hydrolase (beta-lactamase superfamily II)
VHVDEIAPGLWRWTALHPEWTPEQGGPEGWEAEVGCVYWEAGDAVVLVDPLVPAERERFWGALDRDVERLGLPVVVLLTCAWHARSASELARRYGAAVLQPDVGSEQLEGATLFPPGGELPGAAVSLAALPAAREVVYWLPGPRAVVPGDAIVGTGRGLRLSPASWLEDGDLDALAGALLPLLELPVERVLVSHGEPVLDGAREALAQALSPAA